MRSAILSLTVLAPLLSLPNSTTVHVDAQTLPGADRQPYEIVALSARTLGVDPPRIQVAVTARDERGIGWVDVDCAGEPHRVAGEGRAVFTALITCRPERTGFPLVQAIAFSIDGSASGRSRKVPVELLPHATENVRVPTGRVQRRLADRHYPQRVGAFDTYAEALVPVGSDDTPWWRKWAGNSGRKPFEFASHCGADITKVAPEGHALRCWLELHPNVRKHIVWHEYVPPAPRMDGASEKGLRGTLVDEFIPYDEWTEEMKIWLDVSVYWAYSYLEGGAEFFTGQYLPDVAPNLISTKDEEAGWDVLARDDVWNLYLGTIAHSLAVEIGRFVPWSIVGYADADLELLFHSDHLVEGTHIGSGEKDFFGYQPRHVLPAPPTLVFEFLVNNDLIRPTAYATTGKFIAWGQADFHLVHTGLFKKDGWPEVYPGTALYNELFYGYRGGAPLARLLEGTPNPFIPDWISGWVPMCHGMAEVFQHVLRMVNIPVEGGATWDTATAKLGQTGHATPFFWTLGRTLSHADDVYSTTSISTPPHAGELLLISMDTYETWFLGDDELIQKGLNTSRQAYFELPPKSLSDSLLQLYCVDKASGATHADGTLAAHFKHHIWDHTFYTVEQLEAMDLWEKLGLKAAALGFCQ